MPEMPVNELTPVIRLFTDLQHGDCWVGTNFREALHGIPASVARQTTGKSPNSIWQLVYHVMYWRATVINRLSGNLNPPPFTDMSLPGKLDEEEWRRTLLDFETLYHQLRTALIHFKPALLHQPSVKPEQTHYQLIMGCLQHDAYHLGQLVLLKRMLL